MEWISVTVRLPKEVDDIIVCRLPNGFLELCYFDDEEQELKKPWRYDYFDKPVCHINNITHWMPLPSPTLKRKKRYVIF